jgi:hypothetical protein
MSRNHRINHNGPAIWGGCVTRCSIRVVPIAIGTWYFSREVITVQGGYGALFAIMVQILLSITSVAVQVWSKPRPDSYRDYPRLQSWWRELAQCRAEGPDRSAASVRGTNILIACIWACLGATAITNLSWEQEQKQKVWQATYPYCPCYRALLLFYGLKKSSLTIINSKKQ